MPNDPTKDFEDERKALIRTYKDDKQLQDVSRNWLQQALDKRYVYNFSWLGRPIIQLPTDMVAFQEIVWNVKPDLIIEAGIAHGGSLILSASLLAMLDYADALENGTTLDPKNPKRKVLAIDIDIRDHNRKEIEAHPLANYIEMIEGSSIDKDIIEDVHKRSEGYSNILVSLDSNHTHDHVLEELKAYAPLTSKGSYCIVFDTVVEDMPEDFYPDRPWQPGNNPKTAVREYLSELEGGEVLATDGRPLGLSIDHDIEDKLLVTVTPEGFLKRT